LPEAATAVVDVVVVIIRILDGRQPRRGELMTRLPRGGGGSYYPHRRMGSTAHGFCPAATTPRRQDGDNGR
jgi:hypothetical protein